jgi:hypothetical protein
VVVLGAIVQRATIFIIVAEAVGLFVEVTAGQIVVVYYYYYYY